jgi:4-amino-4-deoxy-L-arabinose transferase-like glycosyltransferase
MVLLGAVTIFIFFRLAGSIGGRRTALAAAFLLATDPVFLMTQTFDWGPVGIEHFLLVTGCWALYRFGSRSDNEVPNWYLILGFFLFGVALWNKATFVWALTGLTAGGLIVAWPEVRRALSFRTAALAGAAFLAGSFPLVAYNIRHDFQTIKQDGYLDPTSIPAKWVHLESALQGKSLFGYVVAEEWMPPAKPVSSLQGRVAVWIREHLGAHNRSGFFYVLLGLLAIGAPWWWPHRAARFSLVFLAVSWLAMASTYRAGAAAHHVILLWPFPVLLAAIAMTAVPWRGIGTGIAVMAIAMNLLVVSQCIFQFERYGAWNTFTDAIYPLADSLEGSSDTIYVTDWGIFESLQLLHDGRLKLRIVSSALAAESPSEIEKGEIREMLSDPSALLVAHVREREAFLNVGRHLDEYVLAAGLRKQTVRGVSDSNGRPIFEVFRVVPEASQ